MKFTLLKKVDAFWATLAAIGIYDSGDVVEQHRIRIIDIVGFTCLPILLVYAAIAFATGHYYLASFYVFVSLLILLLIYGNYRRKRESFRLVIIFFITISCAVANVLFDNGQGYYVLLVSFLSLLYYGMRRDMLYLSLFYLCLFFSSEIIKMHVSTIEPVVYYIEVIKTGNVVITLSIFVYFLYDTKKNYLKALNEALNEKRNAEAYAAQLMQQANVLQLKKEQIEELKNRNEELSSIVYHQLRSPVATFADMLTQYIEYEHFSKEEFTGVTKLIKKKVDDTLHVVDNLLLWNQKGIDGVQPHALNCELKGLIKKAMAQLGGLIEKKELTVIYPEKINMVAYADANHILIILLNVLTNAVKYSPPGKNITIDFVELHSKCRLLISNNGKGIESNRLKAILSSEPVVSEKGTLNETGTGLGLKICKNLAEKNNGTFDIQSVLDKTTRVVIELPAAM